jgi:cyclic beta-1,2-glucan synthetase
MSNSLITEDLLKKARELASLHQEVRNPRKVFSPRPSLRRNLQILKAITERYRAALEARRSIPPAGEWLVDNLYAIIEHAKIVQKNFPADYHRRLPVIVSGPDQGRRRVFALIDGFLESTGGKFDPSLISGYLWAYQEVQPLTMGELWAIPLVLRLTIITKIKLLFENIQHSSLPAKEAYILEKEVSPILILDCPAIHTVISQIERVMNLTNPAVLINLAHEFRESSEAATLMKWLEEKAQSQGLSLPELMDKERRRMAEQRTEAGYLITGLHEITHMVWEDRFEELSQVEQILRTDPARVYPRMDFASRDLYRHELELIAYRQKISEITIAHKAVELAEENRDDSDFAHIYGHVGYYLIDDGRQSLYRALGRRTPYSWLKKVHPHGVYFFTLIMLMGVFYTAVAIGLHSFDTFTVLELIVLFLVFLIPAGEWATQLFHRSLTTACRPKIIPKMDYANGVPAEAATMIVIPTLLTSVEATEELARKLEVYHLGNMDPKIIFGLLTDFTDAPYESIEGDDDKVNAVLAWIDELNKKYPHKTGNYFHLLHRRRLWNPTEGVWMGWERKRGKLMEFNALLSGEENTSFSVVSDNRLFPLVRFVITLDTDTQLPRDAAFQMIGAIAHPLNRPVVSEAKHRVVRGYGILQPRVAISVASANRSFYASIFSGQTGIDAYSCAVSDPYQDLFRCGIFTGKGIYDVKVFDRLMRGHIPENSVLSHDLLEGGFLRAGLLSDVELIDDYPSTFISNLSRQHRWVRGDWQLLPWLGRRIRNQRGRLTPIRLPLLTRWQMIENLFRSLLGPILFTLITVGIPTVPRSIADWLLPSAVILGIPLVLSLFRFALGGLPAEHWFGSFFRPIFKFIVLPYHVLAMADAIVRAIYRMFISHRRLLEWVTSDAEGRRAPSTFIGVWQRLSGGQLLTLFTLGLTLYLAPQVWALALPIYFAWLSAPIWVYLTSLPSSESKLDLKPDDKVYLREIARRTWSFFDTSVGPEDHWLPPDNLQVDPPKGLAHRTSPTNIGLYLASIVTARDFGYITAGQMLGRLEDTLSTLAILPRWEGHFFNWYDTVSLKPMPPLYVSSVDSGNLSAYLLAVKEAVRELTRFTILSTETVQGIIDSARWESGSQALGSFLGSLEDLRERVIDNPPSLVDGYRILRWLSTDHKLQKTATQAVVTALTEWEELLPWLRILADQPEPDTDSLRSQLSLLKSLEEVLAYTESAPKSNNEELSRLLNQSAQNIHIFFERCTHLMDHLETLATAPNYTKLYDSGRRLFSIGYNVSAEKKDTSYYDLMASEMRQTSYLTIALGQVPTKHWFALGRIMTKSKGSPVLASWSGTMFEYLMPLLLIPNVPNTLWDHTSREMVRRQIDFSQKYNIPWGISESGFFAFDFQFNYQYHAFGVPGLGLKQGLEKERVVAPYATLLALQVIPSRSVENLRRLESYGLFAEYGFYEAVDFTPERLPERSEFGLVKSYMAHHQGMGFLAISNLLLGNKMRKRFMADPRMKAAETLLCEKVPRQALIVEQPLRKSKPIPAHLDEGKEIWTFYALDTPRPEARFLSNGRYQVMVSTGGGGFSRWHDLAVTHWEEDPVLDSQGTYFYIRDLTKGKLWSPSHHPCRAPGEDISMSFNLGKIVFKRNDDGIMTETEICVSPEFDAEIRRIKLTNNSKTSRMLEVTSYIELAVASPSAFRSHPSFSKLFIETEAIVEEDILLAHRRSGDPNVVSPYSFHTLSVDAPTIGPLEFETDRARFLGRGRTPESPMAVDSHESLSGSAGAVLDPVFSLRRRVELPPGASVYFSYITGIALNKEEALSTAIELRSPLKVSRTFDLARTFSRIEIRYLHITLAQANLFQWMASQVFYLNPYRPYRAKYVRENTRGQSGLWAYGISGDLPLVLVSVTDPEQMKLVSTVLRAHEYWRLKGLKVDLVILNDMQGSYEQPLLDALRQLVANSTDRDNLDRPGGVFIRSAAQMPRADRVLLETAARLSLRGDAGSLVNQLQTRPAERRDIPEQAAIFPQMQSSFMIHVNPPEELIFFNGYGGFTPSGREYLIHLKGVERTPMPWISDSGAGATWSENSREYKLTPWSNDPIYDPPGEIGYIKDEDSGFVWSFTGALRDCEPVVFRHGQGQTIITHQTQGVETKCLLFTPKEDTVKIVQLSIQNNEDRLRKLSVTYYLEWVLGVSREQTAAYIFTDYDKESGALYAQNTYNDDFFGRYGFIWLAADDPETRISWTGDRAEFIGRNGCLTKPVAMNRVSLSCTTGADIDPCGAYQGKFTLPSNGQRNVTILIGAAASIEEMRRIISMYKNREAVENAHHLVEEFWNDLLGQVQVETPDLGMNLLLNRWLLYQTLVCRMWARSAFYQSGGAFGFRDQLQDSLALLHARPELTRKQLLLHAAHQFKEGDVQHWWHEETNRGIRTKFSDDLLWLPYAAWRYAEHTGDHSIWDEKIPYLEAPLLEEDERYGPTQVSDESGTFYEHCIRAIERGLRFGAHDLPLMGSGDWNDGMSKIGHEGRGESVWLGWFIETILKNFAPLCTAQGEPKRTEKYVELAEKIAHALNKRAWDGHWYRRAYNDLGQPVGSIENEECQIDCIAQAWAVISGAGEDKKMRHAMASLETKLVSRQDSLIRLLTPAFNRTQPSPGYIQAYPPGIRENGGQYTHGAIWAVIAWAMLGEGNRAMELFNILNPIYHAQSYTDAQRYKVEPYVMTADLYSATPWIGRGGWSWYTGAAGWMFQAGLEWIIGLQKKEDHLVINPCIPDSWKGYKVTYRYGKTLYKITVKNPYGKQTGGVTLTMDKKEYSVKEGKIPLKDDGGEHQITLVL